MLSSCSPLWISVGFPMVIGGRCGALPPPDAFVNGPVSTAQARADPRPARLRATRGCMKSRRCNVAIGSGAIDAGVSHTSPNRTRAFWNRFGGAASEQCRVQASSRSSDGPRQLQVTAVIPARRSRRRPPAPPKMTDQTSEHEGPASVSEFEGPEFVGQGVELRGVNDRTTDDKNWLIV